MDEMRGEVAEFWKQLPDDYRGAVTFHFDGNGVASWERFERGQFEKPKGRRRIVVQVTDSPRESTAGVPGVPPENM